MISYILPWLLCLLVATPKVASVPVDCDPCIERADTTLKVIVHGVQDSLFWQQVQAAIVQTCTSLRVQLDFELYSSYNPQKMAQDIRTLATAPIPPDALLVSLPTKEVEEAVQEVVESGVIPGGVFGLNSGYHRARDLQLLGFVAMDEHQAGQAAMEHLLSLNDDRNQTSPLRVLYLNHEKGNFALEQRRNGLAEFSPNETIVEEMVGGTQESLAQLLPEQLSGCPYQAIFSGGPALETIIQVSEEVCPGLLQVVFDTSERVYQLIAVGKIQFAIAQQHWLQGAMASAMATLHATTGMRLQYSTETQYGTYLSGPKIVTLSNLPTDTLQICEGAGYPICSHSPQSTQQQEPSTDACACFDRSKLRIAAVTHGTRTEEFWIGVHQAAHQAAMDMGVQLEWDLFDPLDDGDGYNADLLYSKMASKMISLCQSDTIDGLIVSIPSDQVQLALQTCRELNVPMVSINAGDDVSQALGLLHHVAQQEYTAGIMAGNQLIEMGQINRGLCINQGPELSSTNARCDGFQTAMEEADLDYLGMVPAPLDNLDVTIKRIEDAVQETSDGDWNQLGLMAMGQVLIPALKAVKKDHPEAMAATFDSSPELSEALNAQQILFGINQQQYLQGYMPVLMLSWVAQTKQNLANHAILSGPSFILQAPTAADQQCLDTNFFVCPPPVEMELNQLGYLRILGFVLGGIVVLTAMAFALVVIVQRDKKGIQLSQPFFLLMVAAGAALMGSTIFVLSIDDEIASERGCNAACVATPWLFTLGFSFVFAALYSKLMRLNKLIRKAQRFQHIQLKVKDVMTPFAIHTLLNVTFLMTWTVADPRYWKRTQVSDTESYGRCHLGDGTVSTTMFMLLLGINILALIAALVQAYKARKLTYELTDAGSVAMVVVSIFQVTLVGIPILPQVWDNPIATFLLTTFLVFVISLSTLLFIFVPIFKKEGVETASRRPTGTNAAKMDGSMHSGISMYSGVSVGSVAEIRMKAQAAREQSSGGLTPSNGDIFNESSDEDQRDCLNELCDLLEEGSLRRKDVLEAIGAGDVLNVLRDLLKEGSLRRKDVLEAIGDGDVLNVLRDLLKEGSLRRKDVLEAIGAGDVLNVLRDRLKEGSLRRKDVLEAIGDGDVLNVLRDLLKEGSLRRKDVLEVIGDGDVLKELRDLVKESSLKRKDVLEAIGDGDEEAADGYLVTARQPSSTVPTSLAASRSKE